VEREGGCVPVGGRLGIVFTAGCALFVLAGELPAQAIRGEVVTPDAAGGLAGARVEVLLGDDVVGVASTDEHGEFVLYLPRSGTYRLRATRLGYAPALSGDVEIRSREMVMLRLHMSSEPIPLAGITVEGLIRDPRHDATYEGLHARRATARSVGTERIVIRGDPEMEVSASVRDVIRWFLPPRGCVVYYLDGRPSRGLDFFWQILDMHPSLLEGIEYYRNSLYLPVGFDPGWSEEWRLRPGESERRPSVTSGCSVIAVWRERAQVP
jgi:hypothetical protein